MRFKKNSRRKTKDDQQQTVHFMPSCFYDLAFSLFSLFYFPFFVSKIRNYDWRQLIKERLGIFSADWKKMIGEKKVLWVHAVSVGEVMAARIFLESLMKENQSWHVVLTTVTATGQKIAKDMEGKRITVCYFPLDISWVVRKFFRILRPECLLLVETELWPNLIKQAIRRKVPVGVINGRLSPRSVRRYLRFQFIFKPLFESLSFVLAQTQEDGERFRKLGVQTDRLQIAGNMKFDQVSLTPHEKEMSLSLKREWHFDPQDRIWIAGSTHPGEEEKVLQVFTDLREQYPFLKLVVAPRHIERSQRLYQIVCGYGFSARFATDQNHQGKGDVLILDRLGILKNLYSIADVVFVGGSFVRRGGQNPIEPACFKKPILHGPFTFNFENVYETLDQEGGALLIRDENQLRLAVRRLLDDETERQRIGQSAYAAVQKLQGAVQRHVEMVVNLFSPASKERTNNVEFNSNLCSPTGGRKRE